MELSKDVEWICKTNHDRRKWAEEYLNTEAEYVDIKEKPVRKKKTPVRAVLLSCATAAGSGATFAGMGLAMGHTQTLVLGLAMALIFGGFGCYVDVVNEEDRT